MFETSVVQSQAVARRRYSLLSVSLVAHTTAILGAVAISVATVDFPSEAPDQFELLRTVDAMTIPPPLGTPEGNDKPKAEPEKKAVTRPVQPKQETAPSVVPAQTPQVAVGPATPGAADPNAEPGTGPRGVPDGDPNSVLKDLDIPLTPSTPAVEDKVYIVGGDVKAPRVLHRVEPRYPQFLIRTGKTAVVTVRCTIDKNGAVRDIGLVYSSFPAFNEPVIDAMQQWRFAPGSLNGRAVDTVFELTVKFSVNR